MSELRHRSADMDEIDAGGFDLKPPHVRPSGDALVSGGPGEVEVGGGERLAAAKAERDALGVRSDLVDTTIAELERRLAS